MPRPQFIIRAYHNQEQCQNPSKSQLSSSRLISPLCLERDHSSTPYLACTSALTILCSPGTEIERALPSLVPIDRFRIAFHRPDLHPIHGPARHSSHGERFRVLKRFMLWYLVSEDGNGEVPCLQSYTAHWPPQSGIPTLPHGRV